MVGYDKEAANIGADIAEYLSSRGFYFFRNGMHSYPDRELTDWESKMIQALYILYPYHKKYMPSSLV